ncbi:Vegetative incompatibility protein HET-E-1 [Ceratocystis fimbriata CBS 114723]|uniref:Vegetative incompatibility protein HET-E-1 n=1 Tax=Ceratocystis fimbriata CBS 114723 TaxID=1035309 RepID=A0A2C5WU87_9PEZI|nr:Vegetative incompatibility protein HET-E-1 [Ceratocystis fimbriata CBS 114723]
MKHVKRLVRKLRKHKSPTRGSGPTTPGTPSPSVSKRPRPEQTQVKPPDAGQPAVATPSSLPPKPDPEPELSPSIQERIWNQAYKAAEDENKDLVKAFEKIVFAEVQPDGMGAEPANRTHCKTTPEQEAAFLQVRQFVQDGISRTEKGASTRQKIDQGLQVVNTVRGFIEKALSVVPEAAFVWATFSLGIDVLSNAVNEALENRKGIEYVLCRLEWYWELAGLLLEKNTCNIALTTALRNKLEGDVIHLFQKLILYQMRSVCVYHRSEAATIFRDTFRVDDWAGQLEVIKEAEEVVRYDVEQYSSQESKMQLQKLNDTADTLQRSLQSIHAVVQNQAQQQEERHEIEKNKECLSDLRVIDPRMDKKNIEEKKGGLLGDCSNWVLEHADYQRLKNKQDSRILWIKGDPGKGKTMLLCGIIDDLESDPSVSLSYFFCQATGGDQQNKASSVLRGLIYHLARQNTDLIKYVREKYDYATKDAFNNDNSWHELCEILNGMLNDRTMKNAILIVDALDECAVDLLRLLSLIVKPSPAQWIVSSRNWPIIEEELDDEQQTVKIHLEENERSRHVKNTLVSLLPGLDPLYQRMLRDLSKSQDADLCKNILGKALVAYRPITVEEMHALIEEPAELDSEDIRDAIRSCASFLTLHNNKASFVHQSAKDYLLNKALSEILPSGIPNQHHVIFLRSLDVLSKTLKRDIYQLSAPGYLADEISVPNPDPLATIRYSCLFWIDHLLDSAEGKMSDTNDEISAFLKNKYLEWLEALSLLRSIPAGVRAMEKLKLYMQEKEPKDLGDFTNDAWRFVFYHGATIEMAPLQIYVSALMFSPTKSLIRQRYCPEEPSWIELKPKVEENWNPCLRTLENGSRVTSVAFSHDGQRLASGSLDGKFKIWDTTSGACLQTFDGRFLDKVYSLVFSHDGKRIASGSTSSLEIWDVNSGASLKTLEDHGYGARLVVFSHDGERLASVSNDNTIKLWDATSGLCVQTFEGHDDKVGSVAFLSSGQRLVSVTNYGITKIWDMTSGTCLQTFGNRPSGMMLVVLSYDGERLASTLEDGTIEIWNVADGACLRKIEANSSLATSLVFSRDGQRLASGLENGEVKIWDATVGTCLQTLEGHRSGVRAVVFSHDGRRLASGSGDRTVKLWDVASSTNAQSSQGFDATVKLLAFSNDTRQLVSWSYETAKVWDSISGVCLRTVDEASGDITSVAFSNDKQQLSLRIHENKVKIWDEASGTCLQTFDGHDDEVTSAALSHDICQVASGLENGEVKIWDAADGACLRTFESSHDDLVRSVVFSHDGQQLASGSDDWTVKTWNAADGACLHTLKGHDHYVSSVVFSHDGQRLASGSYDCTVKIWDAADGACLHTLKGHTNWVISVVFSHDGQQLASGSDDCTVKIWNAADGACLHTLKGHDRYVSSVVFSHDGQRLASGSYDCTVKIWNAADGACLHTLKGHDLYVSSVVFSHDGQWLASGSDDQTVRTWHVASGVCLKAVSLGLTLYQPSFGPVDSTHTPMTISPDMSILAATPSADQSPTSHASSHHYTVTKDKSWVLRDGERLLWFPPGHRPRLSTVAGRMIGLGEYSGRCYAIQFSS